MDRIHYYKTHAQDYQTLTSILEEAKEKILHRNLNAIYREKVQKTPHGLNLTKMFSEDGYSDELDKAVKAGVESSKQVNIATAADQFRQQDISSSIKMIRNQLKRIQQGKQLTNSFQKELEDFLIQIDDIIEDNISDIAKTILEEARQNGEPIGPKTGIVKTLMDKGNLDKNTAKIIASLDKLKVISNELKTLSNTQSNNSINVETKLQELSTLSRTIAGATSAMYGFGYETQLYNGFLEAVVEGNRQFVAKTGSSSTMTITLDKAIEQDMEEAEALKKEIQTQVGSAAKTTQGNPKADLIFGYNGAYVGISAKKTRVPWEEVIQGRTTKARVKILTSSIGKQIDMAQRSLPFLGDDFEYKVYQYAAGGVNEGEDQANRILTKAKKTIAYINIVDALVGSGDFAPNLVSYVVINGYVYDVHTILEKIQTEGYNGVSATGITRAKGRSMWPPKKGRTSESRAAELYEKLRKTSFSIHLTSSIWKNLQSL